MKTINEIAVFWWMVLVIDAALVTLAYLVVTSC